MHAMDILPLLYPQKDLPIRIMPPHQLFFPGEYHGNLPEKEMRKLLQYIEKKRKEQRTL